MPAVMRTKELNRRHSRRIKLQKLRHHYKISKSDEERNHILAKVKKVSPMMTQDEFLAPLEKSK
jgi:hypothetical protein